MSKTAFSLLGLSGASSRMRRADRLVEKGDPAGAFAVLARGAKAGDAQAQFRVGCAYLEATGVPPSAAEAAHWLKQAAASGHAGAQARLAALCMQGVTNASSDTASRTAALFQIRAGGPDHGSAMEWARLGAAGGSPDAMAVLATILTTGPEAMRNLEEAETWYRRSAEGNCAQGCFGLSLLLVNGQSNPEQRIEAARLMVRAAGGGLPMAAYLLGVMHNFAIGLERDVAWAAPCIARWPRLACGPARPAMAWR